MTKPKFSLVIATYNRAHLVRRAIESGLTQDYPDLEAIVVDDASTENTPELLQTQYPQVRYLRQPQNRGPGPARNRGIREARGEWVVVLDDDDTLNSGALKVIAGCLCKLEGEYPVVQFAVSNGYIPEDFRLIRLEDYLTGVIQGDFTPVIHRERFLAAGLAYPEVRIGAEHLLWWRIAKTWGIPTWNVQTTKLGVDAPMRLSHSEHRVLRAAEYARMQEMTLENFPEIEASFPAYARQKHRAAAVYWLLAGQRKRALAHLRYLKCNFVDVAMLWGLLCLPSRILRQLFVLYCRWKRNA